jgi:hypothetical protein
MEVNTNLRSAIALQHKQTPSGARQANFSPANNIRASPVPYRG